MRESEIQRSIQLELAKIGVRLFRNNTGYLQAKNGQYVHFGLCTGSSDLVGIVPPSGRFLAIEVKTETGKTTKEQEAFLNMVNSLGGIGFIARSPEEALQKLKERL
jgi:hypothetical protein